MKKTLLIILALVMVFVCVGCGGKTESGAQEQAPAEKIDVDLTKLSSALVYSEVYNMVNTPEDYIGKTVKINGLFNATYYDQTKNYYYYVIIPDATACCQQGIEFIWNGEHKYPDDYPENGDNIEIVGTYGQYEELGVTYNYLRIDELKKV